MKSIREKIMQKIHDKEIKKTPSWIFVAKNYLFWVFCALSVIIGALAFSTFLFLLNDYDWDVYPRLHMTLAEHVIGSLPYLWIIVVIVFVWLAYREFKNTKTGYRFMPYIIVGGSIVMSIVIGSAAYALGVGETVDDVISENIPPYRAMMRTKFDVWRSPDAGLIAGRFGMPIGDGIFEFIDLEKKEWDVHVAEATWLGPIPLSPGMEVRIVGKQIAPGVFQADEIRMWRRDPMRILNHPRPPMKVFYPMDRTK